MKCEQCGAPRDLVSIRRRRFCLRCVSDFVDEVVADRDALLAAKNDAVRDLWRSYEPRYCEEGGGI